MTTPATPFRLSWSAGHGPSTPVYPGGPDACIKMARDGSGTFQINAYLSHGGGLFAALLEVSPTAR